MIKKKKKQKKKLKNKKTKIKTNTKKKKKKKIRRKPLQVAGERVESPAQIGIFTWLGFRRENETGQPALFPEPIRVFGDSPPRTDARLTTATAANGEPGHHARRFSD